MGWLLRQGRDLLCYWILPGLCFLMPVRAANAVARFVARRSWCFREQADWALANARAVAPVGDAEAWQSTFRLVRFLDAVDTWHGRFSSDRRIARSLVIGPEAWPEADSVVMLGTHLGPGTLFLRCLATAGWRPRFVFRDIPHDMRSAHPVFHAYLRWRVAYLRKVCRDGEITVPGGRQAVLEAMGEPGCALVLLQDAPSQRRGAKSLRVLERTLPVDGGGLELAAGQQARAALFAMTWDAARGRRVIEVSPPFTVGDGDGTLARLEAFLADQLVRHPAQWQLWGTADPVLGPVH